MGWRVSVFLPFDGPKSVLTAEAEGGSATVELGVPTEEDGVDVE